MTLLGIDQKGKPTKNDYCKTFRDLPIGAIDTTLVVRILEPIWAGKTETASRIRCRVEQVIDAAKAKGEFKGENPARWKGHLDNLLPATSKVRKVRNHPALAYRQLPDFMRKLRERDGVAAAALEFDGCQARQRSCGKVGPDRSADISLDHSGRTHEERCRTQSATEQGGTCRARSDGSHEGWQRVHLPQQQGHASK